MAIVAFPAKRSEARRREALKGLISKKAMGRGWRETEAFERLLFPRIQVRQ